MTSTSIDVDVVGLGEDAVDYLSAWDLQRAVHDRVVTGGAPDSILLL